MGAHPDRAPSRGLPLAHPELSPRNRDKLEFLDQVLRTADDVEGLTKLKALLEARRGYLFFEAVEGAKVRLSSAAETRLVFEFENIDLDVAMTRQAFERSIADETRSIAQCMDGLLADVGATKEDIGVVFLTGGTSRVPCVWNLFAKRFGEERDRRPERVHVGRAGARAGGAGAVRIA